MPPQVSAAPEVSLREFQEARKIVSSFAYHTPLLTSRLLSERTGFDVRLKAEMFQKGGSYKVRGPLNKFRHLTEEQRQRGVICSSAGNHAQGVALAAGVYKMKAVVVMASNATQSKVDATRAYGAEVVQHGLIWDEANEKAKQLLPGARADLHSSVRRPATHHRTGHAGAGSVRRLSADRRCGGADWRRRADIRSIDGAEGVKPEDQNHRRGVV